jgi:hypothetical protein
LLAATLILCTSSFARNTGLLLVSTLHLSIQAIFVASRADPVSRGSRNHSRNIGSSSSMSAVAALGPLVKFFALGTPGVCAQVVVLRATCGARKHAHVRAGALALAAPAALPSNHNGARHWARGLHCGTYS